MICHFRNAIKTIDKQYKYLLVAWLTMNNLIAESFDCDCEKVETNFKTSTWSLKQNNFVRKCSTQQGKTKHKSSHVSLSFLLHRFGKICAMCFATWCFFLEYPFQPSTKCQRMKVRQDFRLFTVVTGSWWFADNVIVLPGLPLVSNYEKIWKLPTHCVRDSRSVETR